MVQRIVLFHRCASGSNDRRVNRRPMVRRTAGAPSPRRGTEQQSPPPGWDGAHSPRDAAVSSISRPLDPAANYGDRTPSVNVRRTHRATGRLVGQAVHPLASRVAQLPCVAKTDLLSSKWTAYRQTGPRAWVEPFLHPRWVRRAQVSTLRFPSRRANAEPSSVARPARAADRDTTEPVPATSPVRGRPRPEEPPQANGDCPQWPSSWAKPARRSREGLDRLGTPMRRAKLRFALPQLA